MITTISLNLPDDVAEYLRSAGDASATVHHLMTDARRAELSRAARAWAAILPAEAITAERQWIEESNDIAFAGAEW